MRTRKYLILASLVIVVIFVSSGFGTAKDANNDNEKNSVHDYYFSVPSMHTEINVINDGSIEIYYRIEFFNHPTDGRDIDIIDVGFPNVYYELDSVKAWLNGSEITSIWKSEYIDIGVEIHLDEVGYIYGGQTGILEVVCRNPKMVYSDSEKDFASVVFYQTWYGSLFSYGYTSRTVRFYFPQELTNEAAVQRRVDYCNDFALETKKKSCLYCWWVSRW